MSPDFSFFRIAKKNFFFGGEKPVEKKTIGEEIGNEKSDIKKGKSFR